MLTTNSCLKYYKLVVISPVRQVRNSSALSLAFAAVKGALGNLFLKELANTCDVGVNLEV